MLRNKFYEYRIESQVLINELRILEIKYKHLVMNYKHLEVNHRKQMSR